MSSLPFPWSLAVHHQSLVSRSLLPCKNEAPEEEAANEYYGIFRNAYACCVLFFLQEEAKRWKERGNHLSKEPDSVELAIAYYSLALSYTPPNERDLKATILSNRSLMYKKTGKDEEALRDAQQCVQNNPNWAKVTKFVHLAITLSFFI